MKKEPIRTRRRSSQGKQWRSSARPSLLGRWARIAWIVLRHAAAGIVTVVLQLLYLIWKRRLGL